MHPRLRAVAVPLLLGVAVLAIYLLTGAADLKQNGDTDLRFQTAQAIVEYHRAWVDQPWWYDLRMVPGRGGHLYAYYAPGQALFMVPLYILGRVIAHHLSLPYDVTTLYAARSLDLWLGALLAVVFYLMGRGIGYSARTAVVLTLIFAFATAAWPDAQSALEQTQVDLFLLIGVYAVWRFVAGSLRRRPWMLLAGAAAGLAVFTRYDAALYVPVLALYPAITRLVRRESGIVWDWLVYAAGALPGAAIVAYWDWLRFGSVFNMGLRTPTFGEPVLVGLGGLTISPGKGLLWYVPILLLLPWAAPRFARLHPSLSGLFAALVLMTLGFYSGVLYWHGDPAWGPRYLYAVLPYLVLPLGTILQTWPRRALSLRAAFLTLTAVSLAIQVSAVSVTQWRYWYHLEVIHQQTSSAAAWTGRPFHWGPQNYHYYWIPSQSPLIWQFADLYQVVRLDMGDRHYYLGGQPDPYVSSPAVNYPVNTLNFWWADVRHPLLGARTRLFLALLLLASGLLSALAAIGLSRMPGRADGRRRRASLEVASAS